MKKKIDWKQIISTTVSVLVALSLILFLFLASDSAELSRPEQEEQKELTLEVEKTWDDAFITVAENDRFTLDANMKKAWLHLTDKKTGASWWSVPEELAKAERIKGAPNMQLASLIAIRYANRDDNETIQNAMMGSVMKNKMNAKKIENGVRFEFHFANEGFIIPVEITLDERGMQASVCVSEIQEAGGKMQLTSVVLLPGFGAAKEKDKGGFLIPDGSGMIVPYERTKVNYSGRVYGPDSAVVHDTKEKNEPQIYMPVYGYMQDKQGLLAVITEGGSRAGMRTVSPTSKSPFASVSSEMVYRESIQVKVSQKTFDNEIVTMFEPNHTELEHYTVAYYPCEGGQLTDLADSYRSYLIREKGMKVTENPTSPLQVEFLGGITVTESVLGIPMTQVKPVTSFEKAGEILSRLEKGGAGPMTVLYTNWAKGGSSLRLTVDGKAENALGGKKGLTALMDQQKKNGGGLFLDLNLNEMTKSQHGFSSKYDAAESVRRDPAIQYQYLPSTYQIKKNAPISFLLAPHKVLEATKMAVFQKELAPTGWAPSTIGNLIYSDFGKENVDRSVTETLFTQSLQEIQKNSSEGLLLKKPYGYAVPYASYIQDAPAVSGHPLVEGASVPFYTMVLHGLVPMGSMPVNNETQEGNTLLQALECGTGLKVLMGSDFVDRLSQTRLAELSGMEAEAWIDPVLKQSAVLKDYLKKTDGQTVKTYDILSKGVRRTVFENGVGVIVNYTDKAVTVDGQEVPAMGYLPIGW